MNAPSLNRRDFLRITSVGASGIVLGFTLPSVDERAPAADAPFEPNAWVAVGRDGSVTITVAKQEMGQGVLTSLAMIVAEEMDADWETVRSVQADAHPTKYGGMGTGGSSSVRGSYDRLRKTGAAVRSLFVSAAAKSWNVSPATLSALKGAVIHAASGRRATYASLIDVAATIPVPEDAPLKDPKDFLIMRKPLRRLDTPEKVNGRARYGIDVRVPNMLFAVVARSREFGGTVASYDATAAKAVRDVRDILQIDSGIAVLATNTWAAMRGRDALNVTWKRGPWAQQSSDAIWAAFEAKTGEKGTEDRKVGDPDRAFVSATRIIEAAYQAPLVAHATMEPMNCTADVRPDACEIWAPTQVPQRAQSEAARILGLPIEKVVVHVTHMGGGFGRRLNVDYVIDAVQASQKAGRPVQVLWTREDDMTHDWYRPCTLTRLKAGLDADGNIVAWSSRVVGPSSRGLVVSAAFPEYEIPNAVVDYHIVDTGVPIGAWRAVGPSQNIWVVESFIDECAAAAGKDPLAYRLNMLRNMPRHARALRRAADEAGWNTPLPAGRARGIAMCEDFGSVIAEVAEVEVSGRNVSVRRVVAAVDCGPYVNPDTIRAQVEGAMVYGLSAALGGEITIKDGGVEQQNFDSYPVLRMSETPAVDVHIIESDAPIGGIGEPGLPPASPAVCNAVFKVTGTRVRKLPIALS